MTKMVYNMHAEALSSANLCLFRVTLLSFEHLFAIWKILLVQMVNKTSSLKKILTFLR